VAQIGIVLRGEWIPSTPAVATTPPASKNATFMKLASAL
jgi:hypothetical protein